MILVNNRIVPYTLFPAKEINLHSNWLRDLPAHVEMVFEGSEDIMRLLLVDNLLRKQSPIKYPLTIKYFPYARQDRHTEDSTPFSLRVMVDVIKLCNVSMVTVWDPHSDVLESLFPEGMLNAVEQHTFLHSMFVKEETYVKQNIALVAPDAGALKKIYKSAKPFKLEVIKADKNRDVATGEIVSTSIHNLEDAGMKTLLICDDISDGCRSFIELAKAIKKHPNYLGNKIELYTTHGIFSKGLSVLEGLIDKVYCPNVMNPNVDLEEFNKRNEKTKETTCIS